MSFPWLTRVDTHSALRVNWRLAFQDLGLALALGDNELGGRFLEEGHVVSSLQQAPQSPPNVKDTVLPFILGLEEVLGIILHRYLFLLPPAWPLYAFVFVTP